MNDTDKSMQVDQQRERSSNMQESGRHPISRLRRQIDNLFSDFGLGSPMSPFGSSAFESPLWGAETAANRLMPAVDISEKQDAFEITAELPGLEEKDLQITLANGNLTIQGEKKAQSEEDNKNSYYSERYYGSFQRSFSLPQDVDAEKIEARFNNGVLTLHLPRKPEAMPTQRQIPISSGG